MLKYEKMLHLDQHYEKLQEVLQRKNSLSKAVFSFVWYGCLYTMIFFLLRYAMISVPDVCAWRKTKTLILIGSVTFESIDLIYYFAGLLTFIYGMIRLQRITCLNHSVRKEDTPTRLLTEGDYQNVRHPMYGTFVILYAAILLSMRSLNGLILMVLFVIGQYCNAYLEEKKLRNLFEKDYMIYCKKTRLRLLTKGQIVIISSVTVLTILGVVV